MWLSYIQTIERQPAFLYTMFQANIRQFYILFRTSLTYLYLWLWASVSAEPFLSNMVYEVTDDRFLNSLTFIRFLTFLPESS
jgi:hypothetical protein